MTKGKAPEKPRGAARPLTWAAVAAIVALTAAGVAFVLSSTSPSSESVRLTGSVYPNVDMANTRHVGGPINSATVSNLEVAWTLPLTGQSATGAYRSSPAIVNGVIYSQDLVSDVQAIELDSGEVLWERSFDSPAEGPNGVAVANGRVYGTTTMGAFALDQASGEEIWSTRLARNASEKVGMAPGYHDGLVYVSTIPAASKGGEIGVLWALNAKTGEKVWKFNTVPPGLWGNPALNFGGGLSQPPAFDGAGSMYFGVANPGPVPGTKRFPWGSSRPGPNLYTGSIVKLDAKTGELEWHYQLTPHAICDWDLQGPPILVKAGGRNLVIAAGKSGIVIALDRETGRLVWKQPVGIHNGHDNDGLYAMKGEYSELKLPLKAYPGALGGVNAPPSTDGAMVFLPVINQSTTLLSQTGVLVGRSRTGELVALDLETGAVEWARDFPSPALGNTTVVNDLVFVATLEGRVHAFDVDTGDRVWEAPLPAGTTAGVAVSGETLVAPAGAPVAPGQELQIVAYRLRG